VHSVIIPRRGAEDAGRNIFLNSAFSAPQRANFSLLYQQQPNDTIKSIKTKNIPTCVLCSSACQFFFALSTATQMIQSKYKINQFFPPFPAPQRAKKSFFTRFTPK
jgi:hypothetical protein